jgi:hypothetical protein
MGLARWGAAEKGRDGRARALRTGRTGAIKGHDRDAPDPKAASSAAGLRRAQGGLCEGIGPAVPQATAHLLSGSVRPGGASSRATCRSGPKSTRFPRWRRCTALGARICVPVIAGAGQPLDFREWTPDAALVEGPFKALVPETRRLADARGADRAAGRVRPGAQPAGLWRRVLRPDACTARWARRPSALPSRRRNCRRSRSEATDQPLDAIVTEQGCLERGN